MSVNGEIYNAYNLHIIKNTVTIAPRGNLQIYYKFYKYILYLCVDVDVDVCVSDFL